MYKVQFDARVFNPNRGAYTTGWVSRERPFELREESTDVPEYEFETYEDAADAIKRFIGEYTEEDRESYVAFYAEDSEVNYDTDEDFTYGAVMEHAE